MTKSALISVYDKKNVVDFARGLKDLGWRILSTGGSYKKLKEEGIEVVEVSEITGFPEVFDGRVKTLHPKIHGGILYRRDKEEDKKTLEKLGIESIDMVVNNLYPFEAMLDRNADLETMIENIDIGGPAMIRAAAKNYKDVIVLVDPKDYDEALEKLRDGSLDCDYRRELAGKAFSLTAYYDSIISAYFNDLNKKEYPEYLTRGLKLKSSLRYGENPHQSASYYIDGYLKKENRFDIRQLHGKEISYNNLNDLTGCLMSLKEFDRPTAVGVKHTNPSGIACDDDINKAFDMMIDCDDTSIFGGIIALNRPMTTYIAKRINSMFMEIVIAPSYDKESLEILEGKKNIRILECPNINEVEFVERKFKDVVNGSLVQNSDRLLYQDLDFVTERRPSQKELEDLIFGLKASKHINSNGVVLVKDEATVGYGFGEVRRSWAVEKAIERAGNKVEGSVLASDGFFFEDTVELLHKNNIKACLSPGGSIHDQKVIDLCNKYQIALVFTHTRHFKH